MVLTVDVPSAEAGAAMEYLGWPVAGTSTHVALVRTSGEHEPVHATFESGRTVSGRNALALTLELPAELGHVAMRRLGIPSQDAPIPVAVALLAAAPKPGRTSASGKSPGVQAGQQAALRVADEPFQRYLRRGAFAPGDTAGNKDQAIAELRARLGIESRAELRTDPEALRRWHALIADFENHIQGRGGLAARRP